MAVYYDNEDRIITAQQSLDDVIRGALNEERRAALAHLLRKSINGYNATVGQKSLSVAAARLSR